MLSDLQRPLYEVKAGLFKGLAHPIRIRILEELSANAEVSVSELIRTIELEVLYLSQHLSVLRGHKLVASERRGSQVFYRLAHPKVADLLRDARSLLGEILESTRQQLSDNKSHPEIAV